MLNRAYGDVVMNRTACFKRHKRFKGGRQSIDNDERPGRYMLTKSTPCCAQIDVWPLGSLPKSVEYEYQLGLVTRFWPQNWRWTAYLRNLCHARWPMTKIQSRPRLSGTAWSFRWRRKLLVKNYGYTKFYCNSLLLQAAYFRIRQTKKTLFTYNKRKKHSFLTCSSSTSEDICHRKKAF